MVWTLIEPNINLSGPTEKTKRLEAQRIIPAEKEGDEEELEKYSTHYILAEGRKILQKLGWDPGETAGARQRAEGVPAQEMIEDPHWQFGRTGLSGVGMPLFSEVEYDAPKMLLRIMEHFRQCHAIPLDMLRSHSFAAEKANNKLGIAGKRIMHAYCAAGMAWH
eukprot:256636-Pyramimonas_sp.AAC.1